MKLSRLVDRIQERNEELTREEVQRCVKAIHTSIIDTLARSGRVEIRGFGSYFLSERPAHEIRNPHSGKVLWIPARRIPRFKAGKLLKASIDMGMRRSAQS